MECAADGSGGADREIHGNGADGWIEPSVAAGDAVGKDVLELLGGGMGGAAGAAPADSAAAAAPALTAAPSNSAAGATLNHESSTAESSAAQPAADEDEDEYAVMSAFLDSSLLVHDPSAAPRRDMPAAAADADICASASGTTACSNVDRTYEISVCYDNFYKTPRIFLRGFLDTSGAPLPPIDMLDDVMQDHVQKTATLERHPHANSADIYLSIHPCRHAEAMKRIIDSMVATPGASAPTVEAYLFIFLKFVSSMLPTLLYDNTLAVAVGGGSGGGGGADGGSAGRRGGRC